MEKIVGLIDAPFTPFYANGDVNLEPIEAYAKMLQKNVSDLQRRRINLSPFAFSIADSRRYVKLV